MKSFPRRLWSPPGPDGHITRYSLTWLAQNSYEGQKRSAVQPRILWSADIYSSAKVPSASWDKFMSCDEELKNFLNNFLLYGIAFVEGVPPTLEATETATQRVSLIRSGLVCNASEIRQLNHSNLFWSFNIIDCLSSFTWLHVIQTFFLLL